MFAHAFATAICIALFTSDTFHAAASVQLVHVDSPPMGDNSMMVRHNAYIDSKLRQYSFNILNHEGYHVRNMAVSPVLLPTAINYASNISLSAPIPGINVSEANFSSPSIQLKSATKGSTIMGFVNIATTNASLAPISKHSSLKLTNTRLTKTSMISSNTQRWDADTNMACISKLGALYANASSPAGISACYNIRSLDSMTGTFNVDLRLYRSGTATDAWPQVQGTGMSVGLSYIAATVTLQPNETRMKRNELSRRPSHLLESKLNVSLATRDTVGGPRLLQVLLLSGQVDNSFISGLQINLSAISLLTPKINLAGALPNGVQLSTQLSLQHASFVNGLFVNHTINAGDATRVLEVLDTEWVYKANTFAVFPIGSIAVGLLGASLLVTSVWDMTRRLVCRYEDRKRMRRMADRR